MNRITLPQALDRLERAFGPAEPPAVTDPWEAVLWENVVYLADDERRSQAFETLKQTVGIAPEAIAGASDATLRAVAALGSMPDLRAERLRECAETVLRECDGDLDGSLDAAGAQAGRILKQFPSIGDPGAEKILLFSGRSAILALESNGLRVLIRLGFADEQPSYAATYRRVLSAVSDELTLETAWLIRAHQLLRRHGRDVCRRTRRACIRCPLEPDCPASEL
jgi:endonuclease III